MRLLITGGCGFIGQHLVFQAKKEGHDIWVLDNCTRAATGWEKVGGEIGDRLMRGDVCVGERVEEAIYASRPDVVLHLAAQSHVDNSLDNPAQTMRVNAMGTQVMASKCAKFGLPIVYCSTDEVYGDSLEVVEGDGERVNIVERTENHPLHPSSPYSAGKAAGEMAIRAMSRSFGLRYVIARGCNAWGENQYHEKLVPIACRLLNHQKPVPLHGGGAQIRQWIHVSEFADRLLACAAELYEKGIDFGTFNIAGPTRCSVHDLIMALAGIAGVPEDKAAIKVADRPGQDMAYALNGDRYNTWMDANSPKRDILNHAELAQLLSHYTDSEVRLAEFATATMPKEERYAT